MLNSLHRKDCMYHYSLHLLFLIFNNGYKARTIPASYNFANGIHLEFDEFGYKNNTIGRDCPLPKLQPNKAWSGRMDSSPFSGIFLASSFSCSQTLSMPAHPPLTHTVRQLSQRGDSHKCFFDLADQEALILPQLTSYSAINVAIVSWIYLVKRELNLTNTSANTKIWDRVSWNFWSCRNCDYLMRIYYRRCNTGYSYSLSFVNRNDSHGNYRYNFYCI